MEFKNVDELISFLNEIDGFGLAVTDEELLTVTLQDMFDSMPKEA